MRDTSFRREKIISLLKQKGSVQVVSLAEMFSVSTQTIRADLNALVSTGIAARAYGGAINSNILPLSHNESAISKKQKLNAKLKAAIGKAAAKLIKAGDTVLLDSGSTTLQLSRHIPDRDDITVLSNDLGIISILSKYENLQVMMLGGRLRHKNMSFYGAQAEQSLKSLHVDKVFLGVDGFSFSKGISTYFEPEAVLNRMMCQSAGEIIAVMDASKIDRVCMHKIIEVNELHVLVTDDSLADQAHQQLSSAGIKVIIA